MHVIVSLVIRCGRDARISAPDMRPNVSVSIAYRPVLGAHPDFY